MFMYNNKFMHKNKYQVIQSGKDTYYCDDSNELISSSPLGWLNNIQSGSGKKKHRKWKTLVHNGVIFHPQYTQHNVPIIYENEQFFLPRDAEEYITYYIHPRYDKYKTDKFKRNFFRDWRLLLPPLLQNKIKAIDDIDTSRISAYIASQSGKKKESTKNAKNTNVDQYKYAVVDDVRQEIDNYIVEPPTIFTGRGNHPLSGRIKKRINPEDITLNVGTNMTIPIPIVDGSDVTHKWGKIISDNKMEWIASWQNNVTIKTNYARFGRRSTFKMKSDEKKYDLARKLKKRIKKIRERNYENMTSDDPVTMQSATALYLIDTLALRIGNEKREDEADTVGVTTLKIKNITLLDDNTIRLDFVGKDSIRYTNKIKVPAKVYQNLEKLTNGKTKDEYLFPNVQAEQLNKYISNFMKNLTSKVFRTYNASYLMQIELRKIIEHLKNMNDANDLPKKAKYLYDMANLKVAKLCNHQKVASQNVGTRITKTNDGIKNLKTKLRQLRAKKRQYIDVGKKTSSINKLIDNANKKVRMMKDKKKIQTESKTLSTGTSKINYIDPRITIAFIKSIGITDKLSLFFNESQQKQFKWAIDVPDSFVF